MFPSPSDPAPSEIVANARLRAQLIRNAQAGDHAAFEVLFLGYRRLIWNLLWHLVGKDAADDLVQDTFLRAWHNLSSVDCDSAFSPWLKKIAANLAVDYLRRKRIINFYPLSERDEEKHCVDPEQVVIDKDCMEAALNTLSERARTCILLADKWDFSDQEIAELLQVTEKTVSSYLSRSRKKFRQEYRRLAGGGPNVQGKGETGS